MRLMKETLMRSGTVMAGIIKCRSGRLPGELNPGGSSPAKESREQSRLGAARHHRMPRDLTIWMGEAGGRIRYPQL